MKLTFAVNFQGFSQTQIGDGTRRRERAILVVIVELQRGRLEVHGRRRRRRRHATGHRRVVRGRRRRHARARRRVRAEKVLVGSRWHVDFGGHALRGIRTE